MKFEDKPYSKFGLSMTKNQIAQWNKIRSEMWNLLDDLRFETMGKNNLYKKATRAKDLISQLPIFDEDGNGYFRSGNAMSEFNVN